MTAWVAKTLEAHQAVLLRLRRSATSHAAFSEPCRALPTAPTPTCTVPSTVLSCRQCTFHGTEVCVLHVCSAMSAICPMSCKADLSQAGQPLP